MIDLIEVVDYDLALLYEVPTKALKQQVKRNHFRFPDDFMFELSKIEKNELVTNCDQ
ncbi:ORF6N domain-containing protein [bacterium]|nr:MAG: ORF6N domain-containing protein [bacterium]